MDNYRGYGFPGHPTNGKLGVVEVEVISSEFVLVHGEIRNFDQQPRTNKDVPRCQISVNTIKSFQVLHPRRNLSRDVKQISAGKHVEAVEESVEVLVHQVDPHFAFRAEERVQVAKWQVLDDHRISRRWVLCCM